MSDLGSSDTPALPPPPGDRLDSWKEIAAYLARDVTTVQRWEKREGMPVHRHVHDKKGSVYGFRTELDAWARSRNLTVSQEGSVATPPDEPEPVPAVVETVNREDADSTPRRRVSVIWPIAAATLILALAAAWWSLDRRDYFWRDPITDARFQSVTDFEGTEQAAAISRDGRFVAFLSDRDGALDVWVTQVGTGQFYNLTRGRAAELVNPSVRTLGFSPDGALVTYWARRASGSGPGDIGIWAIPTLGGEPRPYLEGAAEFDWSSDGSRLVYHTPAPGDPMFVRDAGQGNEGRQVFVAPAGLHSHYPVWSADGEFIYYVYGTLPEAMDVWRIRQTGGAPERITQHNGRVSHPVLLDQQTLLYLAGDRDDPGPWLHSVDVERRISRRLGVGLDRYTSLAASADGSRIVATRAIPKGTLWRLRLDDVAGGTPAVTPVSLTTGRGFSPRLGPGYLLYVSSKGTADAIWKVSTGAAAELWSAPDARIVGGPEIAPDGRLVTFSVEHRGRRLLYVMTLDGTGLRVVTDAMELRGAPAWAPDGQSIVSAADVDGTPHLFRISLDGTAVPLIEEYALDPVWSPAGDFFVYSGADIGTAFAVNAATSDGRPYPFPDLTLTRGARRLRFLPGKDRLVIMRGDIRHKNLWLIDLETGAERQLTDLPPDFNLRDFDIAPDGREIVLERVQEHSDVVLIELGRND